MSARLSAQSSLVTNYYSLRISDARRRLFEESLAAYGRSLQIVQNQVDAGIASQVDLTQAQTLYEQTRAQLVAEGVNRALFEHAIAALIGRTPAEFSLAPAPPPQDDADRRRRHPVGAAGAPARHRLGRAPDGVGQCADRRRGGGLLSGHHPEREHQLREHDARQPAVDRQRGLVARAAARRHRDRRRRRAPRRSRARGPTTIAWSRPTARP